MALSFTTPSVAVCLSVIGSHVNFYTCGHVKCIWYRHAGFRESTSSSRLTKVAVKILVWGVKKDSGVYKADKWFKLCTCRKTITVSKFPNISCRVADISVPLSYSIIDAINESSYTHFVRTWIVRKLESLKFPLSIFSWIRPLNLVALSIELKFYLIDFCTKLITYIRISITIITKTSIATAVCPSVKYKKGNGKILCQCIWKCGRS